MVTIQSDLLTAQINPFGAELSSVVYGGREWIWEGDPAVWEGRAPILFPLCGSVAGGSYLFEGQEYRIGKHGFARDSLFTVTAQRSDSVTMTLTDSPETRAQYPFAFALDVTFTAIADRLEVCYTVTNRDDKTMYYSLGAHEAYDCRPEGIEAYDVVFPQVENARSYVLDGELLSGETIPMIENTTVFPLKKEYFAIDAQVFKDIRSRSVVLRHRESGRQVQVEFPDAPYLLLWTKPAGLYICIEPWDGIPETVGGSHDFTQKEGIRSLEPGKSRSQHHTITYFLSRNQLS